jgi:hypothetical protein
MSEEIYHDSINEHNERIQHIGEIILNLDYWDCECEENYIHPILQSKCEFCEYDQDECPSSREIEVQYFIHQKRK